MSAPGWVKKLQKSGVVKTAERKLKLKVGALLDCGHWGCAYLTSDPRWVFKVSIDPTEGPMQKYIGQKQKDGEYGYDGFTFVKEVAYLKDPIEWRRKTYKVWVIVREEVQPLMPLVGWLNGAEMIPGVSPRLEQRHARSLLRYLDEYKQTIHRYYTLKTAWKKEAALNSGEKWLNHISTWAPYLGQSMTLMHYDGRPLRDVHGNNVGIRRHENVDPHGDPDSGMGAVVCFDPGHTPSDGLPLPTRRLNPAKKVMK